MNRLTISRYQRKRIAFEPAAILVVTHRPALAADLASVIAARGHAALAVATPLDAIQRLIDPGTTICAALVAGDLAGGHAAGVLRYLADEHAPIVRVLVVAPGDRVSTTTSHLADRVFVHPADDIASVLAPFERTRPRR